MDTLPEREAPPDAEPVLHDLFLSLEESLRIPALLHYVEGYELSDIARMMRLPEGTVKSRLYRARKIMRETMEREEAVMV